MRLKKIWQLLTETVQEWNKDKASQLAAALAYYTVFSLTPLLVIVVSVAGFFFGEEAARGEIVAQIQGLIGRDGAEFIQQAIENAGKTEAGANTLASIIGLALLLFGASGVFTQLQDSLNAIWQVAPKPDLGIWDFIRKRFLSFAMVLGIAFLLLVSLVISALLALLNNFTSSLLPGADSLWQVVNFFISLGVITVLFALIYKLLPDAEVRWKDVWVGATITAILFSIGKFLIGAYLGNSGFGSTYGAAGSLVLIVAWIYYSAQILFFGAEFTQVYARSRGYTIVPDKNAVRVVTQTYKDGEAGGGADSDASNERGSRFRKQNRRSSWLNPFGDRPAKRRFRKIR